MHCASLWKDPRIQAKNLGDLTLADIHADIRYKWKTLPTMKSSGMIYPLVCFTVTEHFYWNKFYKATNADMKTRLPKPSIINGTIILIKGGNNRYQSAKELGYTSIDCLIFDNQLDAIKWTRFLDHCDPYNNPSLPYLGLIEYK